MVGDHEVVVDGLRDAHEALVDVVLARPFGQGVDGVHGVVAADIEQDFDVMLVHDLDKAQVVCVVAALELIAARAQSRAGGLAQQAVFRGGKVRQVVEAILQDAFDAVEAAVHMLVERIELVGAHDACQRGVDGGGGATGLGNQAICHGNLLSVRASARHGQRRGLSIVSDGFAGIVDMPAQRAYRAARRACPTVSTLPL